MHRFRPYVAIVFATILLFSGCSHHRTRIISKSDMVDIYADLFLADQWLAMQPHGVSLRSDSTLFYEPIFNKYGYTTEDFRASMYKYLDDPERYARLIKKSQAKLSARADELHELLEGEKERTAFLNRMASIYVPREFYYTMCLSDTMHIVKSQVLDSVMRSITSYSPTPPDYFERVSDSLEVISAVDSVAVTLQEDVIAERPRPTRAPITKRSIPKDIAVQPLEMQEIKETK